MIFSGVNLAESAVATDQESEEFSADNVLVTDQYDVFIAPEHSTAAAEITLTLIDAALWNCIALANVDAQGLLQYSPDGTDWITLESGGMRGTYIFVLDQDYTVGEIKLRVKNVLNSGGARASIGYISISHGLVPSANVDVPVFHQIIDPSQQRESVGGVPSTSVYPPYAKGTLKWSEISEASALELRDLYLRVGRHTPIFIALDDDRSWLQWYIRFESHLNFRATEVDGRFDVSFNWRENS